MMRIFLLFFYLYYSIFFHSFAQEDKSDSVLSFSGKAFFYLNNLEYYNGYREGEPFFGSYIQLRLSYKPYNKFTFSAGVHARKDIGDEVFFSDIRPLFRVKYHFKNFSFIFGELQYKNRHKLLDALLREQYIYNPVVEEGIQLLYNGHIISQDLWGIYPVLNTPRHREKLCVGNCTYLFAGSFYFSLMGYITHYGGQLFAPENDPVRENITGGVGVSYSFPIPVKTSKIGIDQFFIGSYTSDTANISRKNYIQGWGSISKIWMSIKGYSAGLTLYQGNDYITWEGNPMYQSNTFYYFIEFDKSLSFPKDILVNFGFRLDFMDMYPYQFFENGDHQIWIKIEYNFFKKMY
jgi:hypothetical protein